MGTSTNYRLNSNAPYRLNGEPIQGYWIQGDAELDLTSSDSTTIIPQQDTDLDEGVNADHGGDVVVVRQLIARVTTTLASDSTAPQVQAQDTNGNSAGVTISTFADADSDGVIRYADLSDGTDVTVVDLTSEGLQAKVSTTAADSGTAAGNCKVMALVLPWR